MKKIFDFLFSTRLMAMILIIFFVSIATATFLENDYGTAFAWKRVYNASWFNVLLFTGIINLLGVIIKNKLYRKEKLSVFIFHLAFVLILTGAAITRFIGYEGNMFIREGQSADQILLTGDYINLSVYQGDDQISRSVPVLFSPYAKNKATISLNNGPDKISLSVLAYIPDAELSLRQVADGGIPLAEMVVSDHSGRETILLKKGEVTKAGSIGFDFESKTSAKNTVSVFQHADSLFFKAPFDVQQINMMDESVLKLGADSLHPFQPRQLYNFNGLNVVLTIFLPQAMLTAVSTGSNNTEAGMEAIYVRVASGKKEADAWVWKSAGTDRTTNLKLGETPVQVYYGPKTMKLPFSLTLTDFRIERYPGSNSPSWFESRVVLTDTNEGLQEPKRIFMNNILKYKGYRFYQSSYDSDEKGTVLSVNHDLAGTLVTYAGYLLMALGMVLSLMNKNSRFRKLASDNAAIRQSKKLLSVIILLTVFHSAGLASPNDPQRITPVNAGHAAKFGKLLIQDVSGRIEPVNTLSSDVLRKIYRKDTYKNMNSDQVFIGMFTDQLEWQNEPIISCPNQQVQKILGRNQKYFSYASFFKGTTYILQPYVDDAYRKKPSLRSKFDNEIIRTDERVNIVSLVFAGDFLRIFPLPNDSSHTWYSSADAEEHFTTKDSIFAKYILALYTEEARKSMHSGNWKQPDKILDDIKKFQSKFGAAIIPSEAKQKLEILLNKSNIFSRIAGIYGLVGFLLLIYQFIGMFFIRIKNKFPVAVAAVIIILLFIVHTLGLAGRWYVSGHAPWSNGYEALTYIAWATILAGIVFSRKSAITLSATSVLASLILMTANLSFMDPQITNLVPVLKSYWLVIHVATITASYGFLALGALLASVNLLLMLFQNRRNQITIGLSISELSNIIEMTLIVGLYMLTIGTFLGGVWANESWGRYWGWDPKETWALATVLLYAFITHMRMVPGLKNPFVFNLSALLGFSSVIMTYFGVNYYLSGLHSYAKGDRVPLPTFIYYTLAVISIVSILAFIKQRRLNKENIEIKIK